MFETFFAPPLLARIEPLTYHKIHTTSSTTTSFFLDTHLIQTSHMDGPKEVAKGVMGLRPLQEDIGGKLLDIDYLYLTQLELKRTLLRHSRSEVFGMAAGLESAAAEAAEEALQFLVDRLGVEYPGLVHVDPASDTLANTATGHIWRVKENHALMLASLLVQEDLAIMLPQGDKYVLGAAAVCFADQWSVPEKLGTIHK